MTLYDKLNIKKDATPDEIKKAYRKSAKKNHPDKKGDPEEMQAINKAYAILKDPEKRDRYDRTGEEETVNHEKTKLTQIICEIVQMLINSNPVDVKQSLKNLQQEWNRNYTHGKSKVEKDIQAIKGFKSRVIVYPENNLMFNFLDGQLNALNLQLCNIETDYKIRQEAIDFLFKKYDYKTREEQKQWVNIGSCTINTTTGY
jgi:curved DNA-binding protein CbpA